ncbi:MAG: flotillin family protein [Bryobacterales bacterium]|nr:flotillin family protein [Bryobacterales bacterium]
MTVYIPWIAGALGLVVFLLFVKAMLGIVVIAENEVGVVIRKFALDGRKLPNGRIVALNGEPGYQARTMGPGYHFWYWPWMFKIIKDQLTVIRPGRVGLVVARDGNSVPAERIIGKFVACNNFQDADTFLLNGGQKGKQGAVLTAGSYRINRILFDVTETEVTTVETGKVGIVTATDGAPIPAGEMAAPAVAGHESFQNPDAFLVNGGCKGLQEQILLSGQYNLNPWFVEVKLADLLEVPIGHVGVVVSFVGKNAEDVSGEKFTHGNIVPRGGKGVWCEPLYPGKHPLNLDCMRIELVPTTNIVLNWASSRSEAHKLDEKLSTITVRSADGFTFNLDVSQIINIGATKAPWVISRVGSVRNLVNQVLEPIIGNYFRNSAQAYTILDFLSNRADRQKEAREHITKAIQEYDVQSVDTLIGDITPPEMLMATLTTRKVAEEQRKTYTVQMEAQKTRQALEAETALAEKQKELVNEQQNIAIAERKAQAVIRVAEGESSAAAKRAEGEASAKRRVGEAEADVVAMKGLKEAQAVEAIGLARAKAYDEGRKAMGENYALLQIFTILAEKGVRLVPDVLAQGGGQGSSAADALLAVLAKQMTPQP